MSKILARGPFVVLKQINLGLCSKYIILEELYKTILKLFNYYGQKCLGRTRCLFSIFSLILLEFENVSDVHV